MTNSTVIDFLSMNCKHNEHNYCASRWHGLGIEVICNCRCHLRKKEGTLRLVREPVSNASTITGPIHYDD